MYADGRAKIAACGSRNGMIEAIRLPTDKNSVEHEEWSLT